ncbi:crustacean hyperglycemic hormones A-like [Macrobrachium nipponense]|uniref:crustacean hyperglycemic hormones A-like n=1 Tax=Macrobrachium nipponense TaxID=159736 RepID=UPI0030C8579C
MICNTLVWSLVLATIISDLDTTGTTSQVAAAGPPDVLLPGIETLFSSSYSSSSASTSPNSQPPPPPPPPPSSLLESLRGRTADKRAALDRSCKGVYDRGIFMMLDRVCEDCYNLYRKPYVGLECRKRCYRNVVFRQCLNDLLLKENFDSYADSIRTVGK